MPELALTLPWPDKRLSPNARVHWAQKSKAAKAARLAAFWETHAQFSILRHRAPDVVATFKTAEHLHLLLDFYPRDRRRRDDDNLLAMFKPYRDGLADALRIDDSRFISHPRLMPFDPHRKGRVFATLKPSHKEAP